MFISEGVGANVCVCTPLRVCVWAAFELIPFYGLGVQRRKAGGGAAGSGRRPPNCLTSKQGEAPPPFFPSLPDSVYVSAGETGGAASACESVPGFSRVHLCLC